MTVSATALVTRDAPSVPAVTALAAEIQAEQQAKLDASTQMVVGAFFQKLRAEAAVPAGVSRTIKIDRYAVEAIARDARHAEAARFGLYPYLQNDASYQALSSAVLAALTPAFHEITIVRDEGLRITVRGFPNEPKPAPGTAVAVVKDDSVRTAVAALLSEAKSKSESVRAWAKETAKTDSMRAVWELVKDKYGHYSDLQLESDVYLSRRGNLGSYYNKDLKKDALEKLSIEALDKAVQRIYDGAKKGTLPESTSPKRFLGIYIR